MARVFEKLLTEDLNIGVGPATKTAPGGGTLSGTKVGIHSFAVRGASVMHTPELDVTIPNGGSAKYEVSVPGAAYGDFVLVSFTDGLQDLNMWGYVSDSDKVSVVLSNNTGSSVTIYAGFIKVLVLDNT